MVCSRQDLARPKGNGGPRRTVGPFRLGGTRPGAAGWRLDRARWSQWTGRWEWVEPAVGGGGLSRRVGGPGERIKDVVRELGSPFSVGAWASPAPQMAQRRVARNNHESRGNAWLFVESRHLVQEEVGRLGAHGGPMVGAPTTSVAATDRHAHPETWPPFGHSGDQGAWTVLSNKYSGPFWRRPLVGVMAQTAQPIGIGWAHMAVVRQHIGKRTFGGNGPSIYGVLENAGQGTMAHGGRPSVGGRGCASSLCSRVGRQAIRAFFPGRVQGVSALDVGQRRMALGGSYGVVIGH